MSAESYGRVVQRARLTRELQGLRHARRETQEGVARAVDWSTSKLIRVENGTVGITRADLEYLLRHYEVTDENEVSRLAALALDARAPAWWDDYKVPDRAFMSYVGYEAGASSIRITDGLLVPGLLQTEEYMRALAVTYPPAGGLETIVSLRKARQRGIAGRRPDQIYILDEAVLRRRVGDDMPTQLHRLVELSAKPEITILVIPFDAGPHFGMKGPFALLGFAPATGLEDVLYLESARRGDLVQTGGQIALASAGEARAAAVDAEKDDIAEYRAGFEGMLEQALSVDASADLIERIAQGKG
jgi:transcriptional regulator with XRE-family HTH domain